MTYKNEVLSKPHAIQKTQSLHFFQIKISAMTVNGSGPATPWISEKTLDSDLDESVVPDPPSSLKARSTDKEITITWTPPRDNTILVRGYTIGWGKGIPDELTKLVDDKQRFFVIQNLSESSEIGFLHFYSTEKRRNDISILMIVCQKY